MLPPYRFPAHRKPSEARGLGINLFQNRLSPPYLNKLITPTLKQYKFFIFNKFFILHGSAMREAETAPISQKVKKFVPNQGIYNLLPMAIMKETV